MIHSLSQATFNKMPPQLPKFYPSTMRVSTREGEEYLVSLGIQGVGIERLSIRRFNASLPEAMLDGRGRHFAAFPVLIQGAGGARTRAVACDEGEMA